MKLEEVNGKTFREGFRMKIVSKYGRVVRAGNPFWVQINLSLCEFGNYLILLVHKCFQVSYQKENNIWHYESFNKQKNEIT